MAKKATVTLATLDQKLDFMLDKLTEHSVQDRELFDRINEALDGNGKPGLKTSVDRLLQTEDGRKWHLRTIWGAIIASTIAYFIKG